MASFSGGRLPPLRWFNVPAGLPSLSEYQSIIDARVEEASRRAAERCSAERQIFGQEDVVGPDLPSDAGRSRSPSFSPLPDGCQRTHQVARRGIGARLMQAIRQRSFVDNPADDSRAASGVESHASDNASN